MISLDALWVLLVDHAHAIVFVGTLIDATGVPFPGRLLLITAGGLAATGGANVVSLVALAVAGAVVGDHVWYLAGRLSGGRLVGWYCRVVMSGVPGCAERARHFLLRFGPAALIMRRFMIGVRLLITPLAAESGMPYVRYVVCDGIGAAVWCGLWVLMGFALGDRWAAWQEEHGKEMVMGVMAIGAAITLALAVAARLIGRTRTQSAR